MQYKDIDTLEFGHNYTITGMMVTNKNDYSLVLMLPHKKADIKNTEISNLNTDEWATLFRQLDTLDTEGYDSLQGKVILRKSTRNVNNKVSWEVFRRDDFTCRYCGIDNVPMTVDHLITWETGGPWTKENLVTSCSQCNKKRGNLDYGSWLQHKYYIQKSEYLSSRQRKANEDLIKTLPNIVRVVHKPSNR